MKSKTWAPSPGMTERQIEKELNRQMVLFDEECCGSSATDGHIKFQTFSDQWFSEYVDKVLGKRTQHNYHQMTPRIYEARPLRPRRRPACQRGVFLQRKLI